MHLQVLLVVLAVLAGVVFLCTRNRRAVDDGVVRKAHRQSERGVVDVEDDGDDSNRGYNSNQSTRENARARLHRRRAEQRQQHDNEVAERTVAAAEEAGLTRLQLRKLQKQREKEERRAAVEAAEESRRTRETIQREMEAERDAGEAERLEREERAVFQLREERRLREEEEYSTWKEHLNVEDRGEIGVEAQLRSQKIATFLLERAAAVRARALAAGAAPSSDKANHNRREEQHVGHVLVLQDTARALGVTVEQLVLVMEEQQRSNAISGVFDDRGRYIFIAEEHFAAIARFMRQRGRVSISELCRECNRLITPA